jgi:oxygen-independent coproporphyrinogen-3 oxidase
VNAYYQCLDEGRLPTDRGFELSHDDLLRRAVIMTIMCSMPLVYKAVNEQFAIDFKHYFAKELQRLEPYAHAGLIHIDDDALRVTPKGRLFVRAVGMVFDAYLGQPTVSTYSKLI